jgi:hypothetical protein
MTTCVEATITAGTGRFEEDDQRWLSQVADLKLALHKATGSVAQRRIAEPDSKGAVSDIILALGTAGVVTAAVECFKAWLRRDKTRILTVSWITGEGSMKSVTVTGNEIDQTSFQVLVEAVAKQLGGSV